MELKEVLERLCESNEFKLWQKSHPDFYLAHAFVMIDDANAGVWQIGYYNSSTEKMTTFIISPERIDVTEDQEVMRSKQKISELDVSKIKIKVDDALSVAKKCISENYKNELIMKSFFIIQELDGNIVYNITYLTRGFKTINIKINSIDGKIVKHTIGTIAEFS